MRDDWIREGRDGRRGRVVQRVSQKAIRVTGNSHAAYCMPQRMKSATSLQGPCAHTHARPNRQRY